jgi:murein DD-endopeptidase MepM/ murein hydrolase activator NlpD
MILRRSVAAPFERLGRGILEASPVKTITAIFVLLVAVPLALLVALSVTPVLDLPPAVNALGAQTSISVQVHAPHGLRSASSYVEQDGARYKAWETSQPSRRIVWQRHVPDTTLQFMTGAQAIPQLKEGKATLVVEAVSNDFRGSTARVEREVVVVLRPPSLSVDSDQHYLYLGMADLVTFNVSGASTESGVRVGDQKFRSWPMPGGKPGFFSLFAFPWNTPPGTEPLVYATNAAGNQVTGQMVIRFPKKEQPVYRTRDLEVDEHFLQKVINELDPNGSGDPVARFLKVNGEMRRSNNQTLHDLRLKTEARFLWSEPFRQQHNSKVEAHFADVRNYMYQGKKIDQQVHLGYDLSITQHIGVEASNDGKVVYAAPLGIYGNCIVVDHGYGLQTIYGHMSEIAVHEGDRVKRGQIMGKSGMTGMAGGDHIHFSMQLDGVQIDPKEWWDSHWIKDHIAKRVDLPGFND